MNVFVAKNIRLANPVTLLITPYTISEAEGINELDPVDLPPGFSSAQRTFAVLYFLLVFVYTLYFNVVLPLGGPIISKYT